MSNASQSARIKEVATLFFKLGLVAFGGPAAHIAMMQAEVVEKRKWMTEAHFLDLIGATNLIPGPNSTEMTMHCGRERAGWAGSFVAGICFIFPAAVSTALLAYLYVTYGQLPEVEPFLLGIKPAVLVIIFSAIYKLGKKALKGIHLIIIGLVIVALSFLGISEIYLLLIAGLLGLLWHGGKKTFGAAGLVFPPLFVSTGASISGTGIFLSFLKMGAILYGSGYVLMAYLEAELVDNLGWLTLNELVDAIAIGQLTPGPVLSTATFIGFQLDSWTGALWATLGIFLPSFLFVLALSPILPRLQKSKVTRAILDAVNVGAIAVMALVTFTMARETLVTWQSWVILILAGLLFFRAKVNVIKLVVICSGLGYALHLVG